MKAMMKQAEKPSIAVIMPTYNRAEMLRKTLEDMTRVRLPEGGAEIIVADNNSTDRTRETIESFIDRLPVRYCFEAQQGQNAARKKAMGLARAALLVFTDDDVTPPENWLTGYDAAARQRPEDYAFGGPVITRPPGRIDPRQAQIADVLGLGQLELDMSEGYMPVNVRPLSANMMLRRSAFDTFNITIDTSVGPRGNGRVSGSETSILLQLTAAGQRVVYLPDIPVIHRTGPEFWEMKNLERRAFGQGRGRARHAPVEEGCVRLFGVPRFLFSAYVKLQMEEWWQGIQGQKVLWGQARLRRLRCRGTMYEYRQMRKNKNN